VIERLALAAVLVLLALVAGQAIRLWSRNRVEQRAADARLPISQHPRLLVFSSKWCSDCETQRRVIERAREEWAQPIEISYHDAVAEPSLAHRFGILVVPSLVVATAGGRVVGVNQGLADEDRLRSLIDAAA
jgi:thioredoxin-like negative regulator of GroEL